MNKSISNETLNVLNKQTNKHLQKKINARNFEEEKNVLKHTRPYPWMQYIQKKIVVPVGTPEYANAIKKLSKH